VAQLHSQERFSVAIIAGDIGTRGGVNRVLSELALIFSRDLALDVTIFASAGFAPAYSFPDAINIEYHSGANSNYGMLRLFRAIKRRNFNAVIGLWHYDNLRISPIFWKSNTLTILAEHTSWFHPPLKTRLFRRILYKMANWVVVLNEDELRYYSQFLSHVALIPNPVLVEQRLELKKEKIVLCVGHLIPRKNFRDALFAFKHSAIEQNGWRLILVGDGEERQALAELACDLELTNVEFHAETTNIDEWYARSSILLCTSKIEVFSLVVAESTAFGVVPLSYDVDGPAYLLRDFPRLLVKAGDRVALSKRLRWLAESENLRDYSNKVQSLCRERFSAGSIAQAWKALLLPGT
jgi:amylovoran biosynthesis glycosyltransferase AmsD